MIVLKWMSSKRSREFSKKEMWRAVQNPSDLVLGPDCSFNILKCLELHNLQAEFSLKVLLAGGEVRPDQQVPPEDSV